jgi:predicted 3-demethylubiquinone-9 3-methyltransferase (glyoxalase superfamily)
MKKITPFLWFDGKAEEAMNFYTTIFKNSKAGQVYRMGATHPGEQGTVISTTFELEGQEFFALNGGPEFSFTPAISFFINCKNQEEVDYYWERLSEGGRKDRCGWLQDKFGLSWQIVPSILTQVLYSKEPAKSQKAMEAMMKMDKLVIQELQDAYDKG